MGMYDTIYFRCLDCGEQLSSQSKSGECFLGDYDYDNVPFDVAADANRNAPFYCDCGSSYEFNGISSIGGSTISPRVSLILKKNN